MFKREVELNIATIHNDQFNCNIDIEIDVDRDVVYWDIEEFFNQNKFITLRDGFRFNTEYIVAYKIVSKINALKSKEV